MTRLDCRQKLQRGAGFTLDVDFSVPLQGISGIIGPSGAGKTTVLRCIAGLESAEGRLQVGDDVWQDDEQRLPAQARRIGYVFQEPRLFPHLDVADNLDFGGRRRGSLGVAERGRIIEMLGLGSLLTRSPEQLSGGEAQRVAIGRAMLSSPSVVLMDEPLAALDGARRAEVLPFLEALHADAGVPVLYVSHSIDEVAQLCDRLIALRDGRVEAEGEVSAVLADPERAAADGVAATAVIEADAQTFDAGDNLTRMRFDKRDLWVPGHWQGARRLRVRAADVSLSRERPTATSVLNIVESTVETVVDADDGAVLVSLRCGTQTLLSRITRRSQRLLALVPGEVVFAQIKSLAVKAPAATN